MDISGIALQGLNQADAQLNQAASNLVDYGTSAATSGGNVDTVDLATQVVALNSAQIQFQLDIKTLKTANQIQENALNILA
jgi:flagellin-like hook-associated protein FlgL